MKKTPTNLTHLTYGIEIECMVPNLPNGMPRIQRGGYHRGLPISGMHEAVDGTMIEAPKYRGQTWRADSDASIQTDSGYTAVEVVAPILNGEDGIEAVREMVLFLNRLGAKVNKSCGLHVTVGTRAYTATPEAKADYADRLTRFANWHSKAIFGQTGTDRHMNRYSAAFPATAEQIAKGFKTGGVDAMYAAQSLGRGMLNLQKYFNNDVVEFRAFAGTTNFGKITAHIATALGICEFAAKMKPTQLHSFRKNKIMARRTETAVSAVGFLAGYLGWKGSYLPNALGVSAAMKPYMKDAMTVALRMAQQFDQKFPNAAL